MPTTKDERLNLRLSASADALIREAAQNLDVTVSEYVIQSAIQRAHQVLGDQRHFILNDEEWDSFLSALDRPAAANEPLASLLRRPNLLDADI